MGLFDGLGNLSAGDMAALSFFGNLATPATRIPVPFGYSIAQAGAAIPQGLQNYLGLQKGGMENQLLQQMGPLNVQKSQMENLMNQMNLGYAQQTMPYRIKALKDAYNDSTEGSNLNVPLGVPDMSVPNNNPGNMRPVGSNTGFQSFPTAQEGTDAMTKDLNLKISGLSPAMKGKPPTLTNLISTWAPPTENDTESYVKFVSDNTGIAPDQVLTAKDIPQLQAAMTAFEGNASNKSQPKTSSQPQSKLSPQIEAQIKQLKRDKVLAPPEKWGEIDQKIAELYQNDPMVIQEKKEAEKGGENSSEVYKTLNVMTANLPRLMERLEDMRRASKDASYGLGINEEGTGLKQEMHNQFDSTLGLPQAKANAALQQYAAQGILPELGPQLAQAGIRGNKFLETIASNASGLNLSAPPDAKLKLINGLEEQFIGNLKATARQARAYGQKNIPTEAEIDKMVETLKNQQSKGAPSASPADVGKMYQEGKITKEEAKKMLQENHGMQ